MMKPAATAPGSPPLDCASPLDTELRARGILRANLWLVLRRVSQFGVLALFLAGPLTGVWIAKGNLASSLTFDVLPLTDPYVLLQSVVAGHAIASTALIGALIVLAFYLLVGGRVYCSWVCPVNVITDLAGWVRGRLGLRAGKAPPRATRYGVLIATLIAAAATGTIAWELINPVSMLHRGILFGFGVAWGVPALVFVYDVLVTARGWCGHLCPVGAFYALLNRAALLRISASRRAACNDCADCYRVCPEPQVIPPALKGAGTPVIRAAECTNCARCIDVCSKDVFRFTHRFDHRREES